MKIRERMGRTSKDTSSEFVEFLPDIGTFFNQDIEMAFRMIDQLANAGVRCIKGELLHDASICLNVGAQEKFYETASETTYFEDYYELIQRKVVSLDDYAKLFSYCQKKNLQIALSVYDFEGIRFAEGLNSKYIKISSSNVTHKPLIQAVCETNSVLLLDTGHATTEEIARAINWIEDAGKSDFIVQHSPPAPPARINEHNLKYMVNLGVMFGCQYSLSDHHKGNEMLLAAVALGASVVEKGVCLEECKIDQDVNHAMKISEVAGVLRAIKNISAALGSGVRQLPRDRPKYLSRMGLVLKRDLAKEHVLELGDLDFAFPVVGIPVEYIDMIIDKKLGVDKAAGLPLHWEDLFAGN